MEALSEHDWPGNIRELQNVIERGVIMTSGTVLSSQTTNNLIWARATAARVGEAESMSRKTLAEAERAHITAILRESRWVIGGSHGAAARLGLPRTTLIYKMQRLGISRETSRGRRARGFACPPATTLAEETAGLPWFEQQQAEPVGTLGRSQI